MYIDYKFYLLQANELKLLNQPFRWLFWNVDNFDLTPFFSELEAESI